MRHCIDLRLAAQAPDLQATHQVGACPTLGTGDVRLWSEWGLVRDLFSDDFALGFGSGFDLSGFVTTSSRQLRYTA